MGKKVRKYKNVEIMLEPDGFSIHTIELSCKVSQTEWKQIKSELYDYNEKCPRNIIHPDGLCHGCHICTQYVESGIRIRLETYKRQKRNKRSLHSYDHQSAQIDFYGHDISWYPAKRRRKH